MIGEVAADTKAGDFVGDVATCGVGDAEDAMICMETPASEEMLCNFMFSLLLGIVINMVHLLFEQCQVSRYFVACTGRRDPAPVEADC
jgi:hypothetical protein